MLLVIDAAYAEYVRRNDYTTGMELVERADNVVMTRTFSKLFGLAALRLGWLYAPPDVIDVLHRVRGPFNVSAPAQTAGIAALEDLDHQERERAHNDRWLPWLARALARARPDGAPERRQFRPGRASRDADGRSAPAASAWLERHGILARPMAAYGLPQCLRISVGLRGREPGGGRQPAGVRGVSAPARRRASSGSR